MTAFDLQEKTDSIVEFRDKIKALRNSNFPAWEMDRVSAFVAWAIGKLSPLQVGDVAYLTKTPEITPEESWGWLGSKHMLVAGKRGVVANVDWDDGWIFYWEPEAQTWISPSGEEKPVSRTAVFIFGEAWLAKETP